jgi:hypothetical protein
MKLVALMGHEETRSKVRNLFKQHEVVMFSNVSIKGCNCEKKSFPQSWGPSSEMVGTYSSLCFAILEDAKAEAIMKHLEEHPIADDPAFPVKAFLMNIEKFI